MTPAEFQAEQSLAIERVGRLLLRGRSLPGGGAAADLARFQKSALDQIAAEAAEVAAAPGPAQEALAAQKARRIWQVVGQAIERVERLNTQPFDVRGIRNGGGQDGGGRDGGGSTLTDIEILVRDVEIPASVGALKTEIDTALNIIKAVIAERLSRIRWWNFIQNRNATLAQHDYIKQLLGIAEAGLMTGDPSRAVFALGDLQRVKALFVLREAGKVKNSYVMRLWWASALVTVLFLGLYYLAKTHAADGWGPTRAWSGVIFDFRNFHLLAAGTAIGTWISFSLRRQELTFEDLAVLEPDRLDPFFRILYMIGLASLVGLLLFSGAIIAGVGDVKGLEAMHFRGSWALLLGLLSGVAERALGSAVSRSGAGFAASIGGAEAVTRVKV